MATVVPTYTSLVDEEFFGAIGRLTISWAHTELGIDLTVTLLHSAFNGRSIEPEIPWSMQRKLKYIRRCFARHDQLKVALPPVQSLIADIDAALEFRHDIIHGFVVDHPEGVGEAAMVRFLRGGSNPQRKKYSVKTTQILQAAVDVSKLGGRTMKLAQGLQNIIEIALTESD